MRPDEQTRMLVTLPFLLCLLDFWPLQRWTPGSSTAVIMRTMLDKIPFLLMSIISCVVTYFVQKNWGAVVESQSPGERLANAVVAIVCYIEKFFCPVNLAVVYPLPPHWPIFIGRRFDSFDSWCYCACAASSSPPSLDLCRMVLVHRNAGPGHRHRAGRIAGNG